VTRVLGVDLGQAADSSALGLIDHGGPLDGVAKFVEGQDVPAHYFLRFLERLPLGTPYPAQVARVGQIMTNPQLEGARLAVDATGVGRPVVDMMRGAGLNPTPITITGGDQVVRDMQTGHIRVPKRDLVGFMRVLLESRRLHIAPELPLARTLVAELQGFQMKISAAAHDSYNGREGVHDDLVLSVALACWLARDCHGDLFEPEADLLTPVQRQQLSMTQHRQRLISGIEEDQQARAALDFG